MKNNNDSSVFNAGTKDTGQPYVERFTPGPWRLQGLPSREVTLKRRHWAVGQVNAPARGVGLAFGETDANARLIAAAPELYEALARLLQEIFKGLDISTDYLWPAAIANARAALAKAVPRAVGRNPSRVVEHR